MVGVFGRDWFEMGKDLGGEFSMSYSVFGGWAVFREDVFRFP